MHIAVSGTCLVELWYFHTFRYCRVFLRAFEINTDKVIYVMHKMHNPHTYTHTHSHTHTLTHSHTITHTHTHTHTHTCIQTHTLTHSRYDSKNCNFIKNMECTEKRTYKVTKKDVS